MNLLTDLHTAAPEVLLAAVGLFGVLWGAVIGEKSQVTIRSFSVVALGAAAVLAFHQYQAGPAEAFTGLYRTTPFVAFAKIGLFTLAAITLLMSGRALKDIEVNRYEYSLLVTFAAAGGGVMLSANNLMTLYMGIETLSLSSYVLAAFQRDNVRSAEAGLKYFVLGALASGLLLYGSSLVYGFAGSTDFAAINETDMSIGMTFGMVLVIIGLAFKASAAPLHIWTPDVYAGAPAPVVAFFATAPKIAAVVVLGNVLFTMFGDHESEWRMIIALVAALSMVIGAFGALAQSNLKRLLAYSSIANVGFALIGLAAGVDAGASAILVYMAIYVVGTLGLFAGILTLRRDGQPLETISDLNGLARTKPAVAIGMTVLIFSVAGIPPAAGFWGKLAVFEAGINADMLWLVLVGVVSSVVSLGYYLRLVWAIMVKPAEAEMENSDWLEVTTVIATSIIVFPVLTIAIQYLLDAASNAGLS